MRNPAPPSSPSPLAAVLLLAMLAVGALPARGQGAPQTPWTVDPERSVFALLTHKGGFAKGRAHDHLIVAGDAAVELSWDGSPEAARFQLSAEADRLVVDPPGLRAELTDRLISLGLRSEGFSTVDEEQRGKIRETMLGRKQLDAQSFPMLEVRLLELEEAPGTVGEVAMTHRGTLELTAHGRAARVAFSGRADRDGENLTIEATGRLRFSDLGIEPYSAFLGAVKNLDEIDLYLRLVAAAGDGT